MQMQMQMIYRKPLVLVHAKFSTGRAALLGSPPPSIAIPPSLSLTTQRSRLLLPLLLPPPLSDRSPDRRQP